MMPMNGVGQDLPGDELPSRQRRHVQLLERADLLLADNRHGRQIRRNYQQQQRDDARDHEVAAFEARIEPHLDLGLHQTGHGQRRALSTGALGGGGRRVEILDVAADERLRVSHRHAGGIGIGPIRDELDRRRPARADLAAVIGRNAEHHPRLAAIQIRIDLARRAWHRHDLEVGRAFEAVHQLAAGRRSIGVDDRQRNVLHVGRRRVAKDIELDDRREDDDAEKARVLPQLQQLLFHQV